MPELRRGARGQARDDAIDRLPPVPFGGRRVAGRRRRPAHYAQDNGTRAADPARQRRHARARRQGGAALAGGRLRRALRSAGERRRRAELLARVPALPPHRGLRLPRRRRRTAGAGRRRSPACRRRSATASSYQGVLYRKLYDYTGMVTYVLGEFYWQAARATSAPSTPTTGHRRGVREAPEPRADRRAGDAGGRLVGGETLSRRRGDEGLQARARHSAPRCSATRCRPPSAASAAREDLLLDRSSSSSC